MSACLDSLVEPMFTSQQLGKSGGTTSSLGTNLIFSYGYGRDVDVHTIASSRVAPTSLPTRFRNWGHDEGISV